MSSDDPLSRWSSTPYTPIPSPSSPSTTIGYHKPSLPYLPSPHPLHTLSVWIPFSSSPPPPPSFIPCTPNPWVLYIHGGAWRDPKITSLSFHPAALSLLSSPSPPQISGLLSVNYRLSAHPSHPGPSNAAAHPDHISDVLAALSFLSSVNIYPKIIVGHSCGATLAFQSVMAPSRWGLPPQLRPEPKPEVIVGINGLYDLSGFIARPPAGWEGFRQGYEEFVRGAFGPNRTDWKEIGPASCARGWGREWARAGSGEEEEEARGKRKVVLVQSREDGLVPYDQTESMRRRCEEEEGIEVTEESGDGWGDHDEVWEKGDRLAGLLRRVVEELRG